MIAQEELKANKDQQALQDYFYFLIHISSNPRSSIHLHSVHIAIFIYTSG